MVRLLEIVYHSFYSPLPLERGTGVRLLGEGHGVRLKNDGDRALRPAAIDG